MSVLSSPERISPAMHRALIVVEQRTPACGARIGAWTTARPPYDIASQSTESLRARGLVQIVGVYPDRRVKLTPKGAALLKYLGRTVPT